jgi:tetratricopeptide (TPR) repeat protein
MNKLRRYSLLSKTRIEGSHILSVHRQVKRHVRNRLTPAQLQKAFDWILRRLRQLFPRQSPYTEPLNDKFPECGLCISHIIALNHAALSLKDSLKVPELMAQLLQDGATYLWARGLLEEGKSLTLAAKDICEARPDCDQLLIGEVYSFHACILSDSGDVNQACTYFEKAVDNRRQHFLRLKNARKLPTMVDEILLANAYNNLAGIYCAKGDYSDAELYNELSLRLKKRWEKEQNLGYILNISYQNMALVNACQGKLNDAAGYFDQALAINDPNGSIVRRALTYHNYGSMRLMQGQVDVALGLLETAFQLRWERLGDHYDTATSLHMLAACYQVQGDKESLNTAR